MEYILNCLYAELQAQNEPYIQDVVMTSVLEFIWKIAHPSEAYTTEAYRRKLEMFQGLEDDRPAFSDIVDGFVDGDHSKVLKVANSVLFQKILPGARGSPQSPQAQEAVRTAIKTLQAHTVCSSERWIGHPRIPPRVFGPAEYLDEPLKQVTKL